MKVCNTLTRNIFVGVLILQFLLVPLIREINVITEGKAPICYLKRHEILGGQPVKKYKNTLCSGVCKSHHDIVSELLSSRCMFA
jgi:hypothetical protein